MNQLFSKVAMVIRVALRNVFHTKLRALVLWLTFSILMLLSVIAFSTHDFLSTYFYQERYSIYGDYDFYLTYDQNSNTRYFSTRELNLKPIDDYLQIPRQLHLIVNKYMCPLVPHQRND